VVTLKTLRYSSGDWSSRWAGADGDVTFGHTKESLPQNRAIRESVFLAKIADRCVPPRIPTNYWVGGQQALLRQLVDARIVSYWCNSRLQCQWSPVIAPIMQFSVPAPAAWPFGAWQLYWRAAGWRFGLVAAAGATSPAFCRIVRGGIHRHVVGKLPYAGMADHRIAAGALIVPFMPGRPFFWELCALLAWPSLGAYFCLNRGEFGKLQFDRSERKALLALGGILRF